MADFLEKIDGDLLIKVDEYNIELVEIFGWTGKICGVTNPSKVCGVPTSDIGGICGVS